MDKKITMIQTMQYEKYIPLFVRSGLEINEEEKCPEGLITCFEMRNIDTERIIGAAVLVLVESVYVIKAVAVEKVYRGQGLGIRLVNESVSEAKSRGADKVYLNAKIPDFYKKLGFDIVERKYAPAISDCISCKRYKHGCKPEIMVKEIK